MFFRHVEITAVATSNSIFVFDAIDVYNSPFLIKQNNQYYSIKPDFYSEELMMYEPLEGLDFSKGFNVDELFDTVIIGGGGSTDITPVMTSNTTPSPYIVSASSFWSSSSTPPWKAFNNQTLGTNNEWRTDLDLTQGWIQLDFNTPKTIYQFSLSARSAAITKATPKDFSLQGSNDGVNFDIIKSFVGEVGWKQSETRVYNLDSDVTYRYYRIDVTANDSFSSYIAIGKINFFYRDPILETFKPIDKFDNFTLISENASDINYNYKAIKSSTELIVSSGDINTTIAETINYFNLIADDNIKISMSIDNGKSWLTYNSATDKFTKLNVNIPLQNYENLTEEQKVYWDISKNEILQNGIDVNTLNSIDFNRIKSSNIRFAYVLNRVNYEDTSEVENLDWSFNSVGLLRLAENSDGSFDVYEDRIEYMSNVNVDMMKINVSV